MDKNQKLRNAVRVELINFEDDLTEARQRIEYAEMTLARLRTALGEFDEQDAEDVWYTT